MRFVGQALCLLVLLLVPAYWAIAQKAADTPPAGERYAVIFVGIPGDDEHAELFSETAKTWRKWLAQALEFKPEQVFLLPEATAEQAEPAALTGEMMRVKLAELAAKIKPEDTLWVFTLGHGNYDGKQAWFHVAGHDPAGADFGRWLEGVRCREQVFWLTQSNSGWFVKPLSRPGRIVIAATAADDESNETEFPHALAAVARRPLDKLDADGDGRVSIAELYMATVKEVNLLFEKSKRLPTEHPQLDDNGDGKGTEDISPRKDAGPAPAEAPPAPKIDGELANKTWLPLRTLKPKSD